MTLRIAYLTGRTFRGAPVPDGVLPAYEGPDFGLVREAGRRIGLSFEPCYWDAPDLPARGFAAGLIRSCWDYTSQAERFIATLEAHERAGLRLFNPAATVKWNARKRYLEEIAAKGAPVIDTVWADKLDARAVGRAFDDLETAELVAKPQVSAGSMGTIRLKRNAWSEADLINGPQGPAMLQPFLPSIETEGELSLVYFNGALSHTIRKRPVPGEWFANDIKAAFLNIEAPPGTDAIARAAMQAAAQSMLYARVDLVLAPAGDWRVIEIEIIEPYLFLARAEGAAERFARAVLDAVEGKGVFAG
ncbi:MAG: RimK family alpha-L-glutamate ligase [Hyphomonadaceae bacterium]